MTSVTSIKPLARLSLDSETLIDKITGLFLLQAKENVHIHQTSFLAYISPTKSLASLTKASFNLIAN